MSEIEIEINEIQTPQLCFVKTLRRKLVVQLNGLKK